jgi:hypothetical protein
MAIFHLTAFEQQVHHRSHAMVCHVPSLLADGPLSRNGNRSIAGIDDRNRRDCDFFPRSGNQSSDLVIGMVMMEHSS